MSIDCFCYTIVGQPCSNDRTILEHPVNRALSKQMISIRPLLIWMRRLATWDGVLPVFMWAIPVFVTKLFPDQHWPSEILGVVLPVAGCIVRFFIGVQMIRRNLCHRSIQPFQIAAFGIGIFALLIIDSLVIDFHNMPPNPPNNAFDAGRKLGMFCGFFGTYFFCMAIAMFPGSSRSTMSRAANGKT